MARRRHDARGGAGRPSSCTVPDHPSTHPITQHTLSNARRGLTVTQAPADCAHLDAHLPYVCLPRETATPFTMRWCGTPISHAIDPFSSVGSA